MPEVLRDALMTILAAVYETGMVEEVSLGDVMRIFGVTDTRDSESKFSFRDAGWITAYTDFKLNNSKKLKDCIDELDAETMPTPNVPFDDKMH